MRERERESNDWREKEKQNLAFFHGDLKF